MELTLLHAEEGSVFYWSDYGISKVTLCHIM